MDGTLPTPASRADVKALLNRGEALCQSIATLDQAPEQLRGQARTAFHAVREEMVTRGLESMAIERLNDATGGGLRVTALRKAGYTTVARVVTATPAQLDVINGVGPTTANQAVAAARQLADAVRDSLQFRVDLDPTNARSSELISALYRADRFAAITEHIRNAGDQVSTELDAAKTEASIMRSRVRMYFAGSKRRAAAQQALARVGQLVEWADTSGFAAQLISAGALTRHDSSAVADAWKDFERRSPEYYGRLGEIVDLGLRVEAAEGFLPADSSPRPAPAPK